MKVYEKMCEINDFDVKPESKEDIVNQAYSNRIYIIDLLDDDKYKELHDLVDWFLENDELYDGDEGSAWERFVDLEVDSE